MMCRKMFLVMGIFILCLNVNQAESVIINEILADPGAGLNGDANGDGVRSSTQDEFIELLNNSAVSVDLSGWALADASATRHVFGPGSLLNPLGYMVVFGGGNVNRPGRDWRSASSGGLSLNNGGDSISLHNSNGVLIDMYSYASIANNNQSIVRMPEGEGPFVLHSTVATDLFSPGAASQAHTSQTATVPEPLSIFTLMFGFLGWRLFES